ncbi:hypothetical protein [Sphingomonas desiccabilis]|uniref:Uncharacterized protein n=1 Tax=Sphingomonas desiccabilis TaxID=429134 RepID=A0A4Q2J170_9SPHN|nr:hypothetical protein [Sphingomonas desiccabilis]MBB3910408.1 hypothetical protein [Sphingomonas desiccabilis]RXZ35062.1 hypothetical protein EO081_05305 [Sphingomonas desiccabilis]
MRCALPALAVVLAGCSSQSTEEADWHSSKRATDLVVEEALADEPPDYARAITAIERSGRPSATVALETGNLIIAGHREVQPERRPAATLEQGLSLLERAASDRGEAADIAPQHLRLWFERGVGSGVYQAMPPRPELARCWGAVEERAQRAAACIAMRAGRR